MIWKLFRRVNTAIKVSDGGGGKSCQKKPCWRRCSTTEHTLCTESWGAWFAKLKCRKITSFVPLLKNMDIMTEIVSANVSTFSASRRKAIFYHGKDLIIITIGSSIQLCTQISS